MTYVEQFRTALEKTGQAGGGKPVNVNATLAARLLGIAMHADEEKDVD